MYICSGPSRELARSRNGPTAAWPVSEFSLGLAHVGMVISPDEVTYDCDQLVVTHIYLIQHYYHILDQIK
jgi:hypothetical protein